MVVICEFRCGLFLASYLCVGGGGCGGGGSCCVWYMGGGMGVCWGRRVEGLVVGCLGEGWVERGFRESFLRRKARRAGHWL